MKKILFICHGNICRSPMAEFIFKKMLSENGLSDRVFVSSCATSTETIWHGQGEPVYPPAAKELSRHGIFCDGKRSVQLQKSDYNKYDLLICMDSNNIRNSMYIIGADPQNKLCKLMDFTDRPGDVSDPWFTRDFVTCYRDIKNGCERLLEKIKKEL
ncbi:MAG: low molecular weight phosphotyrosine protein phosphatase [Clostridia bacterium]|nr:low molecular weight phosphotyrosine protein phosphatase [Clostridia bacterium]